MPDEKQVVGIVKEIDGDIVTIAFKITGKENHEIDVHRKMIEKEHLQKGDSVALDLTAMTTESNILAGISKAEMDEAFAEAFAEAFGQAKPKLLNLETSEKKPSNKGVKKGKDHGKTDGKDR